MDRMMAAPNGYASDCGAPGVGGGGYPYNYHNARANEDDNNASSGDNLSFLYDRAQGNTYGHQPHSGATTPFSPNYSSPEITDHKSNQSTPPSDYKSSVPELGQGLRRPTPAPAYPYNPKRDAYLAAAGQPSAESLACPTGRDAGTNPWGNPPPQAFHRTNVDARDGQVAAPNADQKRGPDTLERQMSNIRVSNSNSQPVSVAPSPSTGSDVIQNPRPRLVLRTDPTPVPHPSHASGVRTVDRCTPQKLNGGLYSPQVASNTIDPRRNHIRQNIPWRDINAARKFSVPILNRPRIQIADHASDDHMVNGADPLHSRSTRKSLGEVDSSSQRQLLREGDEIGDYDQTSIRYKGRANPSKMFRFVQSAMGGSDSESIEHHQNERRMRRRQKRDEMLSSSSSAAAAEDNDALKDADDVVDISYVGSKIPSRTFRFLQEAIGARDQQGGNVSTPSPSVYNDFSVSPFSQQQPARTVRVVHLRPQKSLENLIGDF